MIDGVKTRDLKAISDERGFLMEMLRSDWEEFDRFGQVYVTAVYAGVVKAWHYHKLQTDRFVCLSGMVKVALYDDRPESPTRGEVNEFFIGERNPVLLIIPPQVMHGFKAVGGETAMVVNTPSELFNYSEPDEYRLPWDTDAVPYDWEIKMG